ncbi:MAG TPA: lamin tail domain-containing protein [Cyclobacteriaceae bacterium]
MLKSIKFLCGLCYLTSILSSAHVCVAQFNDSFSDGDFANNPGWSGDNSKFSVQTNQLRLTAPAVTDVAYLSLSSTAIHDASWEFLVRLDFDPSGSNYTDVYIVSDQSTLTSPLNGYFVRVGGASDEVSLYRQSGTGKEEIIDGLDARVTGASIAVKVKVTRDASGTWQLFSDPAATGIYISEGVTADETNTSSSYFGVVCVYTSTRSDDFYFDDFIVTGNPFVDLSTPADYKDVIITEIFADPTPVMGLPDAEFVELFNRSTKIVNLNGWKFTDGSSTTNLPGYMLQPNQYLILTASGSVSLFAPFGTTKGVSNFPTLNNTGDNLQVRRSDDVLIDQVSYTDSWYRDDDKKQGGHTLELIDPANPCGEEDNWIASEATGGGTPGSQNSVFANKPDLTGPKLLSAIPTSVSTMVLKFDEKLSEHLPSYHNFIITPTTEVTTIEFLDASLRSVKLSLNSNLVTETMYSITTQNMQDCNGNLIQDEFDTIAFGMPEDADSLDLVVNEILFNPRPTGIDFVEVYNSSRKFINLKNWSIANYENGSPLNVKIITTEDFLLGPRAYQVFTEDADITKGEYSTTIEENLVEVADLPGFNDDEGTVALIDAEGNVIDYFLYSDDYHSVFLDDDEGVSLERISFSAPTQEKDNWKSASSTQGFATPGYVNSNVVEKTDGGKITVIPEVFEPITGQPNFTQIQYNFEQGGYVANVKILDFQGREIKELASNAILGAEGFFRWDGDTTTGSKARTGYYVVWVEVFAANGRVDTFRKRVIIAARQ